MASVAAGGEVVLQSVACDQDGRRAMWGPERMGEAPTQEGRREGHLLRRLQSRTRVPSARTQKLKATMTEERWVAQTAEQPQVGKSSQWVQAAKCHAFSSGLLDPSPLA